MCRVLATRKVVVLALPCMPRDFPWLFGSLHSELAPLDGMAGSRWLRHAWDVAKYCRRSRGTGQDEVGCVIPDMAFTVLPLLETPGPTTPQHILSPRIPAHRALCAPGTITLLLIYLSEGAPSSKAFQIYIFLIILNHYSVLHRCHYLVQTVLCFSPRPLPPR